jgi:hypothetical protein
MKVIVMVSGSIASRPKPTERNSTIIMISTATNAPARLPTMPLTMASCQTTFR